MQCPKNTSALKKLVKSSKSVMKLSNDGRKPERSISLEQKEGIEDTISPKSTQTNQSPPLQPIDSASVMQGSLLLLKRKIWKGKLNTSALDSLTTKLSKTWEAALTSKERDLKPFWDLRLEEKYNSLWLPTKTDYAALGLNSSVLSSNITTDLSWSSIQRLTPPLNTSETRTSAMISLASLQFLVPGSTVSEVVKTKEGLQLEETEEKEILRGKAQLGPVKALRIRLYPTPEEADYLQRIQTQSRWFYNCTVNIIFNRILEANEEAGEKLKLRHLNESAVREIIKHYRYTEDLEECKGCDRLIYILWQDFVEDENYKGWPYFPEENIISNRIPRGAVIEFVRAFNSALSNFYAGNNKGFKMGYKSKKRSLTYTTLFEDKAFPKDILSIKSKYCFTKKVKGVNKRTYTSFKDIFDQDEFKSGFTLEYDCLKDKHYVLYTMPSSWYPPLDRRSERQAILFENEDIISLDPGVRTFLTGYNPKGEILEIGKDANKALYCLLEYIDTIKDRPPKETLLLNRKLKNMVKDLHWKVAGYLTKNYKVIILPHFETSKMLKGRKLSKITKRQMQALSFFKFKEILKYRCKTSGSKLILVDEDYTSKTCGCCGVLNKELTGEKTFDCKSCGISIDRDHNGARNILLKNLEVLLA